MKIARFFHGKPTNRSRFTFIASFFIQKKQMVNGGGYSLIMWLHCVQQKKVSLTSLKCG